MITGEWLFQWKCFISNKIGSSVSAVGKASPELKSKINMSANKEIGVLPPGPINNHEFFQKNGELKAGLTLNKDYRGVNFQVWRLLQQIYGGGPHVVRDNLEIYSEDVEKQYRLVCQQQRCSEERKSAARSQDKEEHNIQQVADKPVEPSHLKLSKALFAKAGTGSYPRMSRRPRRNESLDSSRPVIGG